MLHALKPIFRSIVVTGLMALPLGAPGRSGAAGADAMNGAVRTEHSEASLLADHAAVRPGQRFLVALRLRHDAGWHSYWINPGDSGLATRMKWSLPAGWHADDIQWPVPERFEVDGLANYGYAGAVWLPMAIRVPDDAPVGTQVELAGDARWLACADICVAEKARVAVRMEVASQEQPDPAAEALARRMAALPRLAVVDRGSVNVREDRLTFRFQALPDALTPGAHYQVFPRQPQWLEHAPIDVRIDDDRSATFTARRSSFYTRWPDTPSLLLRGEHPDQPAIELRLAFAPPTDDGEAP